MGEKLLFVESLGEQQKCSVVDLILPGIHVFLEDVLDKEFLSDEAESLRRSYVGLLKCSKQESRELLRKRIEDLEGSPLAVKYETGKKSSKLGHVREKKLINIRQFKVNQKRVLSRKMDSESNSVCTTDDESQTIGDERFVEMSKSEEDLLSRGLAAKVDTDTAMSGFLFSKENDGLRRRWCVLEDYVLKCYKRQNQQQLVYEINFRGEDFSAIQGRIGKMYAIRLSCSKRSYLLASQKAEVCASWLIKFGTIGVQLQDDILREVSMNNQNNNKVTWSEGISKHELFRSDLLEALELIERSKSPHILPKRTSYSFKELDVLKKLKASIVSKTTECKLNRRKTWSAGSFPNNPGIFERFRQPILTSEGDALASEKTTDEANRTLPEILTSSGILKIDKQDTVELDTSDEAVESIPPSNDEPSFAKSMPEGLNDQSEPTVSPVPRGSIVAQSVPDLLILPESSKEVSPKQEKTLKPSVSLTRVVSTKASLMKNAIITGFKRRGRRSAGRVVVDRELAEIHGCLFRKKSSQWKQRWCIVMKDTFYAFRDLSYEDEDFRCSLRKFIALRSGEGSGRAHTFKLVRRKGDEIVMAAETNDELERWMKVLQREMAKQRLSEDLDTRSTAGSYLSVETYQDSSAAEDTANDFDRSECGETSDKDSSDDPANTSLKMKPRGLNEQGYMYHLVREDTWEHCWVEVIFGVLSIYGSEGKEKALQRDRIALCDVKENKSDGERLFSFVLTRPGRNAIHLGVDTETEFLKWLNCFKSWKTQDTRRDTVDDPGNECDNEGTSDDNVRSPPNRVQPTTNSSDSDGAMDGVESNRDEQERPKIRRSMTSVLQQLTPKGRRRNQSSAGMIEVNKHVPVKSSFLYFKANSGLWVKYWCVLESSVILCFNSPEEAKSSFSVNVRGCEVRRTSHKTKNFTFEVFNRVLDKHFEFAGESTYIMYAWMRVLKIPAGLVPLKDTVPSVNVDKDQASPNGALESNQGSGNDRVEVNRCVDSVDGDTASEKDGGRQMLPSSPPNSAGLVKVPTSPKRKAQITSLDQVLKLLHEKRLEQELQQNKMENSSKRVRLKWQHAMLVVLRKTRANSVNIAKQSASESENVAAPELDPKTAKVKYREISEKYDHILEDERLKMLRRETLLKKRRNSLILRQDTLKKRLDKCQEGANRTPLKKRQSKMDAKTAAEMSNLSKSDQEGVKKQLDVIKKELEGIRVDISSNLEEQKKIGEELNEQKRKELHELRITVDMSPQTSKPNLDQRMRLGNRRQVSDTSLSSVEHHPSGNVRKLSVPEGEKLKLTHTMSSPTINSIRSKAKSFSSPRLSSATSNPFLRTKTCDTTMTRPSVKSRSSQEALSLALSQIEDFEAFAQGTYECKGSDVGF